MRWFALLLTILSLGVQARGDDHHFNINHATADSSSTSHVTAEGGAGGQASANNSGVSVDGDDHDNRFFSFATTFPQAHGCLGGVQGGGAGSSSGGFFGIHFINENCWTSALAEAEANVEVRSLLKCAGDIFRDAIAFEQTENRQRYCVDFMVAKYTAQIEAARESVEQAIEEGELEATTLPIVVAGNVTEEQLAEELEVQKRQDDQQQNQIDELKRRTQQAEQKAAAAELKLQELQRQQATKQEALQQLQQQLRADYATVPAATE